MKLRALNGTHTLFHQLSTTIFSAAHGWFITAELVYFFCSVGRHNKALINCMLLAGLPKSLQVLSLIFLQYALIKH